MTNTLVGEVYSKIIEATAEGSKNDFQLNGVGDDVLELLKQEWQIKLSGRQVAQMPWDPKPEPPPTAPTTQASTAANGLPSATYSNYETPPSNGARPVKTETAPEHQYNGLPNGYPQTGQAAQGGSARAQQLMQQQYGAAATASVNAMQRGGGGLALPGQPQQARPQGLQLPGQVPQGQQQYSAMQQQQQAAMQRHQQQQLQQQQQQQQQQSRIKVESDSPSLAQGGFQQQQPNYTQTDGADDGHEQWRELLAQRRAAGAEQRQQADRMMRDAVMQSSAELESGLMLPLEELASNKHQRRRLPVASSSNPTASSSAIPQLDGLADDDDDAKAALKDEDDENAINSDLDDPNEERDELGDDDDEGLDTILCTYDKVQRVKNKWKCTLKDGVMSVGGKEWVFNKGTGEFEW